MNLLLANLLIRYTKCTLDLNSKDFIGMDMARKFWKWVLREHVAMQITPVEEY